MNEFLRDADACVVGGGPAGLAAAIALRIEGFSVALLDCAVPPIDKACGEGLMPDSIDALKRLGIHVPVSAGFPFRGVRFVDAHSSVAADFPNGTAIGLRRTALHQLLTERAREAGVSLHWGCKGVRWTPEGMLVDGELLKSKLVVGADGQNSLIRRDADLNSAKCEVRRYAFRRHYNLAPWSQYMELYWGARCQVYVTPVSPSEVCVVLVSRDPKLRLDEALEDFPTIRTHLRSAEPSSVEMGAVTVSRTLKRVCRKNLALLGDASGSVDAITGEGMCLSFRQALALAQSVKAGDLRQYQTSHRALSRRPAVMASLMLALEKNTRFRRRALASLAKHPDIFASLLSIHVGESGFLDLCSPRLLNLGLTFLAA